MKTIEKQVVVEPKGEILSVHTMDVNMTITMNKVTKEQVFKDRSQSRRSLLLIRKRNKNTRIFCQEYIGNASRKLIRKSESKGESIMEYKLGKITRD